MSIHETMKELESAINSSSSKVFSEVYGYRYVKINVRMDSALRDFWVYMGRERDYLLIPGVYCSCKDFLLRTVINKTSKYCKHLLGLHVSMKKGKYLEVEIDVERFLRIVHEIIKKRFSLELRRSINRSTRI